MHAHVLTTLASQISYLNVSGERNKKVELLISALFTLLVVFGSLCKANWTKSAPTQMKYVHRKRHKLIMHPLLLWSVSKLCLTVAVGRQLSQLGESDFSIDGANSQRGVCPPLPARFPWGAPGCSEIRAPLRKLHSTWLTPVVGLSPVLPPQVCLSSLGCLSGAEHDSAERKPLLGRTDLV